MAKYQPSKYYADDKDLHDVLSSPKIPLKRLLNLARRRGIFLSEESPREEIVNYMSRLPFGWNQLQETMVEIEREDREEKLTTSKVTANANLERFREAAEQLKDTRGEQLSENYKITETKDGRLEVRVEYSEPDFLKNRLIQRRQREVVLEVQKMGNNEFEVRSTQNERTETILNEIIASLAPPDAKDKPVRKTIELNGITNHTHRTQFFVNLMGGMEGFRLREVRDLRVDRIVRESDDDEDAEATADTDELKALVRKVALSGENILISPQYQQLAKDGFFISRSVWTSIETTGEGRIFEFEAEFKDAQNASNFAYQIRGVYQRNNDGEILQTRSEIADNEKSQLKARLEAAAYHSVTIVANLGMASQTASED